MWIANLLEKTLMLGKTEDKRRRGRQRMRWLDSITDAMDMNLSKFRKILKDRGTWCAAVHGTWLSKWTTTKCSKCWPRLWGLSNEQSPCPHGAYILVQFNHPVMSSSSTPWTEAHQGSLPFTICRSLLKLMSIESLMPSKHLILCHPLLLLPSIFPSIRVFSSESVLHIR